MTRHNFLDTMFFSLEKVKEVRYNERGSFNARVIFLQYKKLCIKVGKIFLKKREGGRMIFKEKHHLHALKIFFIYGIFFVSNALFFRTFGFSQIVAPLKKIPYDPSFYRENENRILFVRKEYFKEKEGVYLEINSLWIANEDFTDVRFIAYSQGLFNSPGLRSISPDKTKIIFSSLKGPASLALGVENNFDCWLYDLKSGEKTPIPMLSLLPQRILWSSDSKSFFFEAGVKGLFKFNVQNGQLEKIRKLGEVIQYTDRDGKSYYLNITLTLDDIYEDKIVYTQKAAEITNQIKSGKQTFIIKDDYIWLMELPATNFILLDKGDSPRFSPDGGLILYKKNKELWVMNLKDRTKKSIGIGSHPVFSPDGKKIAFVDIGFDGSLYRWLNLCVFDISSGSTRIIPKSPDWKEVVGKWSPGFMKRFNEDSYFSEHNPHPVWLDDQRIVYHVGVGIFFIADLEKNEAKPFFYWDVQVDPTIHYFNQANNSLVLSSAYIRTPRRNQKPLSNLIKEGWVNEYDIWELSLDKKEKKMLIENGFNPMVLQNKKP
ncbi:hypothetical protein BREVNS_1969 [Brevinematales bacterium NS]|nr:hypothetical protein BREVNS_1969 [Brevinematales bacterium NS]